MLDKVICPRCKEPRYKFQMTANILCGECCYEIQDTAVFKEVLKYQDQKLKGGEKV